MPRAPKEALWSAIGTALYVVVVATFVFYAGQTRRGLPPTPLVPIAMLMLLVVSVAIVGAMVFVRPALWYLDGRKAEALALLGYTLAFLFALMLVAMAAMMTLAPMGPMPH
jgi:hypothetical protein